MTSTQAVPAPQIDTAAPQLEVLPPPLAAPAGDTPREGEARASEPKVRNGKIARLPFIERDMVNRMLRDHIPYEKIVGALAEHGI
jgi:hypothetical protein